MKRQTVLITGGSHGIGYEFAKIFARHNYNLVLVSRHIASSDLEQLQKQYDSNIIIINQDLTELDAAQKVFNRLKSKNIAIDILINNAGVGYHAAFLRSDWQRQKQLLDLNVTALMQMCYLFGRDMTKRKNGRILNIASIAADLPGPYMATYFASKAFVLSFSYALADELASNGIKVSTLCPGPTSTFFEKTASMHHTKMFSFLPARPSGVAYLGYLMIVYGGKLRFHGLVTKLANLFLRISPRFLTTKIAKFVNGTPKVKPAIK